jgi:hypothetical protein
MWSMTRRDVLRMAAAGTAGMVGAVRWQLVRTAKASDQYSSVVLAKAPVGYWRLGEVAGPTAADFSGNGYDGTYVGNPTLGQPGAIGGDSDTAIGLNGPDSKDYVEIANPANFPFSQPTSMQGLTVEVWMRPDALVFPGQLDTAGEILIHWLGKCVSGSGQCEWGFRFYSGDSPTRANRVSAYIWNPEGLEGAGAYFQFGVNDNDQLVVGTWYHIVAIYEPGNKDTPGAGVRIYKNGVKMQGPPSRGTLYSEYGIVPVAGTLPLRLGTRDAEMRPSHSAVVSYLTGGLDEAAIYPRVLSDAEILENYCTGSDMC